MGVADSEAGAYDAMLGNPERHIAGLLGVAGQLTTVGRLEDALRYADRARRLHPDNPTLADLCARLLLRLGAPAEALRALDAASYADSAPAMLALRGQARLAAGDLSGAAREAEALLIAYAVNAVPDLEALAMAICRQGGGAPSGWVGLTSHGAARGAMGPDLKTFERALTREDRAAFARTLPSDILGLRSLRSAPAWRLNARARRVRDTLTGVASFGWAPGSPVTVVARDGVGGERFSTTRATARRSGAVIQAFSLALEGLDASGPLIFEAVTPDGARTPLFPAPPPWGARWASNATLTEISPSVAVIVPVYDGREDTLACLRSVLATTDPSETELIVVDDDCPDPRLKADLARLGAAGQITLLVNDQNRGFPHSANRGISLRPDRDIVLLNADAEVFGDWLNRLRAAARATPEIGTVTPFSNNGSMMAYPASDSAWIDIAPGAMLDALFNRLNAGRTVELPSGAGFCLYMKRACLNEVGLLDEATFGRGYGEENDFCLRARSAGWRHVGAADVFVRHVGGISFGPLKTILTAHNLKILYRRYPDYRRQIMRFLQSDPVRPLRQAVDEALVAVDPPPSVLLLSLARGGGVEQHVSERVRALLAEGVRAVTLLPDAPENAGGACRLAIAGEEFDDLTYSLPKDLNRLAALLAKLNVRHVEIHHTLGLDPSALELIGRLGAPYDVIVHDYSWICPRITLIADGADYCGEPDLAACEACLVTNGTLLEESITVAGLRARAARLMTGANKVVVPTFDVARRLSRHAPGLNMIVSPWELPPPASSPPRWRLAAGPIRVAVLGAIGKHKGFDRLLACARDAASRDLPLTFVVVGYTEDDPALFETGRVFVTGPYEDSEAAALLDRESCDVALLPSVWPETWCYTLTHLLRTGLPIVAFDLGAMAERLAGVARASLLPLETNVRDLNAALLAATAPRIAATLEFSEGGPGPSWVSRLRLDLAGVGPSGDIHYAAMIAGDAQTPWAGSGTWCSDTAGDRPLVGLAVRLTDDLGRNHRCRYACGFSSGWRAEASDGAVCRSPWTNDPMTSMEIYLEA